MRRNADSIVENQTDGESYLAMPHRIQERFNEFLDHVIAQERHWKEGNVRYAQTRKFQRQTIIFRLRLTTSSLRTENDNLREEYLKLYEDVEQDIPWARIALDKTPDAVNLWIGNSKSVTALHRDNYENIYCQVTGLKDFVLLPPVEAPCVQERMVPCASYEPVDSTSGAQQV